MPPRGRVLSVDDEANAREALSEIVLSEHATRTSLCSRRFGFGARHAVMASSTFAPYQNNSTIEGGTAAFLKE